MITNDGAEFAVGLLGNPHLGYDVRKGHPVRLFVPRGAKPYPRSVHINTYHFFTRLAGARPLTSSQEVGEHAVVLEDFEDFDGLAAYAATLETLEDFEYGGLGWGWRGETELFPLANGKACISLAGASLNQLIYLAQNEDMMPTRALKEDRRVEPFLERLPKLRKDIAKRRREGIEGTDAFPFKFVPASLPKFLRFEFGKGGRSGFVGTAETGKEGLHIHLFCPSTPNGTILTVSSLQLTCSSNNHFGQGAGEKNDWQRPSSAKDRDEALLLEAMLESTRRSVGSPEDEEELEKIPAIEIGSEQFGEVTAESLAIEYQVAPWIIEQLAASLTAGAGEEGVNYDYVSGFDAHSFKATYGADIAKIQASAPGTGGGKNAGGKKKK